MRIDRISTYVQRVSDRPRVLVKLDTDDGLTGWGEAYNHGPDLALAPIVEFLGQLIAGEDPTRVEFLTQRMLRTMRFPQGALGLAAIAAIDHALWDIAAQALSAPVYQLLGGRVRDRVEVYTGLARSETAQGFAEQIDELNSRYGLAAFKMSPFRQDPGTRRWALELRDSTETFTELREIVDPTIELAFDAHAQIWEPYRAIQLAEALAPLAPMFIEEPIRPEHVPSWSHLRERFPVPLATGESLYSPNEFLALLTAGGADIVQPDICVVGGLSQMRRIAAIAEAHYVPVSPHNPMGPLATAHNLHFAAACSNFGILEYRLDPADWCDDPYLPTDGHLQLRPDRPGWGVTINEAALATDDYVTWIRRVPVKPDGSLGWA